MWAVRHPEPAGSRRSATAITAWMPAARAAFRRPRGAALLVPAVFLALAAVRLFTLAQHRDLYIDEAMLALNVRLLPLSGLLAPMPLFEQAAPLGLVLLAKLAMLAGLEAEWALRLIPAAFSVLGAVALYGAAARLGGRSAGVVAVAYTTALPILVRQGTELKQYAGEFAATAVLLYVFAALNDGRRWSAPQLLAVFVGCILVSNLAPVVLAAFGCAFVAWRWRVAAARPGVRVGPVELSLLGAVALFAAYYLLFLLPTVRLQLLAYWDFYRSGLAPLSLSPEALAWYGQALGRAFGISVLYDIMGAPAFLVGVAGGVTLAAFGVAALRRRSPPTLLGMVFLVAGVWGLSLLGKLPLIGHRHYLFLLPATTLLVALGVVRLRAMAAWRAPRLVPRLETAGLALLVLVSCAVGLAGATRLERGQITPLMAIVDREAPQRPIWVYYGAQPTFEWHFPARASSYLGKVDHHSDIPSWLNKVWWHLPDYVARSADAVAGLPEVWLLFGDKNDREVDAIVGAVRARGFACTLRGSAVGAALYACARG